LRLNFIYNRTEKDGKYRAVYYNGEHPNILRIVNNGTRKIIELSKEDQKFIEEEIGKGSGGFSNPQDLAEEDVHHTFLLVNERSPGNLDEFYYFFSDSSGPKPMWPFHLEFFGKFFD
jgi:hypothetical protein